MMIIEVIDRSSSVSSTWWGCLVVGDRRIDGEQILAVQLIEAGYVSG